MQNELLTDAKAYNAEHKRRKIVLSVVIVLACIAAACTIYFLMLPATATTYECGLEEHTHTDACYTQVTSTTERQLTCTGDSLATHKHTDACYDEQGNLTCGLVDYVIHTHDANCFDSEGNLVCTLPEVEEHVHTDDCYTINEADEKVLTCGKTEVEAHVHTATCYDETGALICGKLETVAHEHTDACFTDVEVPIDTTELTCGLEEGENGHHHTDLCYGTWELTCGKTEHAHTEACKQKLTDVNTPTDQTSSETDGESASEGENAATELETVEANLTEEEIAKAKNDGLLYENDSIIVEFEVPEDIEGNVELTVLDGDDAVSASEQAKANANATNAESASNDNTNQDGEANNEDSAASTSEGESTATTDSSVESNETTSADTTDASAANTSSDNTDATASTNGEEPTYTTNLYIQATLDGEPVKDISTLGMTMKVQVKAAAANSILSTINYDVVADEVKDETGVRLTVEQTPDNPDNLRTLRNNTITDSAVITTTSMAAVSFAVKNNYSTINTSGTANPTFTVQYYAYVDSLVSENGQLDVIDTSSAGNGNTGPNLPQKGDKEGAGITTKKLALTKTDRTTNQNAGVNGSLYEISKTSKLEKMYESETCQYVTKPNPAYFNKLQENSHYSINKIWVLKDGCSPDSTTEADWDIYDAEKCHFTNKVESSGWNDAKTEVFILINDGTVIRMVNNCEPGTEDSETTFFDYDISDGYIYTGFTSGENGNTLTGQTGTFTQQTDDGTWYAGTDQQGINSKSNYGDYSDNARLAFGNERTGTGLGGEQLSNGAYINNNGSQNKEYKGCSFGLTTGLDISSGDIQYTQGLSAPDLFSTSTATGKTVIGNSNLTFARNGDSYTLKGASVNGNEYRNDLNYLFNPSPNSGTVHGHVYTNNFWPMDVSSTYGTDGHDLKFGNLANQSKRWYCSGSEAGYLPPNDDGQDHNSYFGMKYEVEFELSEDYCGPLDYLFFGDDDLWVFLDGQLVLDLGGVHTSVGEYVDLWDYLGGRYGERNGTEKHKLSIFYTERGGYGSTCFMNFTLPSVSFANSDRMTDSLKVSKEVDAADSTGAKDWSYSFEICLKDSNNEPLPDDYSYTRYSADGRALESDLLIWTGSTFTLKDGEYIVIKYLPVGARYTIQEIGYSDPNNTSENNKLEEIVGGKFAVSYKYTENGVVTGNNYNTGEAAGEVGAASPIYEGVIQDDSRTTKRVLAFTNAIPYELPSTGGGGVLWYFLGGGALIAAASIVLLWRRRHAES